MYPLNPPAVYAHESVVARPRYHRRLERVVAALEEPQEPIVFADADLPRLVNQEGLLAERGAMGEKDQIRDPSLLLNTFRFDGRRAERTRWLEESGVSAGGHLGASLLGYEPWAWANYNLPGDPYRDDKVCRPCWRLHFQNGCVHRCLYCGLGGLLVTMVNVEDYIEHLDRLISAHPWQETYLLEDDADIPCLEPELGCLGRIIEYFGTLEDRHLIIHTKTWNVDWMLDLEHRGNTIIVWSLAADTQSRRIEPVCGTTEERIEAARRCQEAGYQIRYKFKPIVPVRGWREEASEAIELLFDRTRPDVISLCVFMWHSVEAMTAKLPVELLDPDFLRAAEEAGLTPDDTRAAPFPEDVRAQIYEHYFREIRRHDPDVPVSLSTENFQMWKRLGPTLGCTARNYVCGCGPNSTPGRRTLPVHPFAVARGGPQGDFDDM
ncbi:MAG: spore photoproduct lyase family protein [Armatimonadota bacterium]